MIDFKILASAQDVSYLQRPAQGSVFHDECYFDVKTKRAFINEANKYTQEKDQVRPGCQGEKIALIMVQTIYSPHTFVGHQVRSTSLVNHNSCIRDSKKTVDPFMNSDDRLCYVHGIVHPLPHGQWAEYQLKEDYGQEMESIYHDLLKLRNYVTMTHGLTSDEHKDLVIKSRAKI